MLFDSSEQPAVVDAGSATATAEPSAKPETAEQSPEALQQEGDSGAALAAQPTEPEDTDFEYEGKKFKVPKDIEGELKNALLRHGDYTRKTQEVADQRKALETERTQHQAVVQTHQALTKEIAQIQAVDERLEQLQRVDWNALIAQNPTQAQGLQAEFTQLQTYRGQLGNSITQKQQQMQFAQQQDIAKRANDAQAFLMREIKDWSPEKDRELESYARSSGINTQQLTYFMLHNPAIAVLIDKAARLDQLQKKQTAKPAAGPAPKPISRVGGAAASNTKLLSDLSPEEYAERRREQRSKRR